MRLGLLGPAGGDVEALEEGARILLDRERADRIIYLGIDGALDRLVLDWARRLVGDDPSDEALWKRAAARCADASPAAIEAFVANERARDRLKALECLPRASSRAIEMLNGRVAILLYDKTKLDEEDLRAASLLVYGRSAEPILRRSGEKMYISPGPLTSKGGLVLLESDGPSRELGIAIYDRSGTLFSEETWAHKSSATMSPSRGPGA